MRTPGPCLCCLLGLALMPTAVVAQPCQFEQITVTTGAVGGFAPAINNAGTRVVFTSQQDLVPGQNVDGNIEVFLFEVGMGFLQITDTVAGSAGFFADISGDGTRIILTHTADLVPGSNPDGSAEVFAFDLPTASFTQLTDSADGFSQVPVFSLTGDEYAFGSTATDLIPGGNPDANSEIFYFNGSLMQVTDTIGGGSTSTRSISDDGTRIVFDSDRDPTGGNPDGNDEVFLYDFPTDTIVQVTDTTGNTGAGTISPDGTKIAYHSGPVGGANIFVYDVASTTATQLTTSGGNFLPALTDDGSRIAYQRITGSGTQIYLYAAATDSSFPITATMGGVSGSAAINANGTRIAFVSSADVVSGMNPDLNAEVYLATCDFGGPPVTEIPTLSTLGLLLLLLTLGVVGVGQLARRRRSVSQR